MRITGGLGPAGVSSPDVLTALDLAAGATGHAKIAAKARGAIDFSLPLRASPRVTAQLVATNASCWTSEFSVPQRNDAKGFRARSD